MSEQSGRSSEDDVAKAVLKVLLQAENHKATLNEIRERLPEFLELSDADRSVSDSRPKEQVWEQQLRNIVSHRSVDGNFIKQGYLESPERGILRLTDRGHRFLASDANQ
ncbi:winged helix-turn-helix domain-containing protein [Pontixanthobacter aquaemixtae]|uniref:winged helix-turn-helix domain-containing protein n=1 Tax=Pontixanthobacter aquaemixtae TaxID=1958940 RepID=UPI0013721C64|nr:winged helix-turn-helix domain-containing protein [Pontixanthobacter aquaemixtae]